VSARRASYRAAAAQRRLAGGQGAKYLTAAMLELARPTEEQPSGQTLDAALVRCMTRSPLPHYLRVEDRNSMAHGIEARVPFLDHRLVELAMRLPTEWKMYEGWNKRVLREAMKGRIPDSVRLRRQKFGFPTSMSEWFAGPLASGLRDIVEDSRVMRTGWFDQRVVRQALDGHLNGKPAPNLLFNIAQLDAWLTLHENGWTSDSRAADSSFVPS
jgi:asparagine synthase (glutamine-hydrolysing)